MNLSSNREEISWLLLTVELQCCKRSYRLFIVLKTVAAEETLTLSATRYVDETVSLEEGESAIPALDALTKHTVHQRCGEWSLALAHREDPMF